MLRTGKEAEKAAALAVADKMAAAAKTAPKGHGLDDVTALILTGEDKDRISDEMRRVYDSEGHGFFLRDARIVEKSHCLLLIGAKKKRTGLGDMCGLCGFENCAENTKAGAKCSVVLADLGIAIGSAVSVAADNRIDNRVLFSAGKAALNLDTFEGKADICFAVPLWTGSKSIFFDRVAVPDKEV
jgi:uncharacterized ferredoxin-like protein